MAIRLVKNDEKLIYESEGSKILYRRISLLRRNHIVKQHTRRGLTDWGAATVSFLKEVVIGWENVCDGGKPVAFGPELVAGLPGDVVTDILELSGCADGGESEKN